MSFTIKLSLSGKLPETALLTKQCAEALAVLATEISFGKKYEAFPIASSAALHGTVMYGVCATTGKDCFVSGIDYSSTSDKEKEKQCTGIE